MEPTIAPADEAQLAEAIQWANAQASPLELVGTATKRAIGRPMQTRATLDMSRFSGIELYEPDELVITAGAGTPLADIEAALAARSQCFAFEPPDLSALLGSAHAGTLGGMLACNLSGPRRIKAGAVRDHVLGIAGVSGRGEAFKGGGRVVKNVTGYDLPKLMAGSHGTLAALTSVTFKALPASEMEETLVVEGLGHADAVRAMSIAMQSSCEVSGAAHLPGRTLLRLEGIAQSVVYRREKLRGLLAAFGSSEVLGTEASRALWREVRDVRMLADGMERAVWRLSVPPSEGARVLAEIASNLDARGFLDWAGGLIWLDVPGENDGGSAVVRGALGQGHATLIRAPMAVRLATASFQPQTAALSALSARVKASFDPNGILNPGRMNGKAAR